jgi:hypothetical protein
MKKIITLILIFNSLNTFAWVGTKKIKQRLLSTYDSNVVQSVDIEIIPPTVGEIVYNPSILVDHVDYYDVFLNFVNRDVIECTGVKNRLHGEFTVICEDTNLNRVVSLKD